MPLPSLRALVGALFIAALLIGCSGSPSTPAGDAAPTVSDPPSPTASPTPVPPAPVEGVVTFEGVRLDRSGSLLWTSGSPADARPTVDEAAVRDAIDQIVTILDAHLTALQSGGPATLPAPLDGSLAPAAARAASTGLTDPDAPVETAVHALSVGVVETAHWIHATTTVTRRDGSVRSADFVFTLGPDGPALIAAGPASGGVR